jgi:hypothetical protein
VTAAADTPDGELILCPFDLRVSRIPRFVNGEFADHPVYDSFEVQHHEDPDRGTGLLVFLSRRVDRLVDYYVDPALRLDRTSFALGAGTGSWYETAFDAASLEVHPDGIVADVRFRDAAGRVIEIDIDDRDGRRRHRAELLLAPVGASIERPTSLLLVVLHGFDLVRDRGRGGVVRIDGEELAIGTLPGRRWHHRLLLKYAAPLSEVTVNRDLDGPLLTVAEAAGGHELAPDGRGIAALLAADGTHGARLDLDPPMPDPRTLGDGERLEGTWAVTADGHHRLTGGRWTAWRRGAQVEMGLDVTERWQPGHLPPVERVVTRVVPTFRRWPTTYRWTATVQLEPTPSIHSRWERTGTDRGRAYRRVTRSR